VAKQPEVVRGFLASVCRNRVSAYPSAVTGTSRAGKELQ
jgi:hypothetical protein